jgi:5-methylcytosine-specific restriction endonuclease McrA
MAAFGIETPCAGQITKASGRKRSQGVVDHVIPVIDSDDPLFMADFNHAVTCNACNDWKSRTFDGAFGMVKKHALSRDVGGVELRRREIIAAMRQAFPAT